MLILWATADEDLLRALYQAYARGALLRRTDGALYLLWSDGRWEAVSP